ncbi:MAG: hypothetical protein ABIJ41_05250 [Candidatus Omnitrophota bacterium]
MFKKIDVDALKEHTIVCGDLSANCSKCNALGLKIGTPKCPECATDFKYLTFRNIKENIQKFQKLSECNPHMSFVDYEDYKKLTGASKAKDFFK